MTKKVKAKKRDWYDCIELAVRDVVKELRNNGINTTCSCGHKMVIQGDSVDLNSDEEVISTIMLEKNLNFELVFVRTIMNHANYRRFYLKLNPSTDEMQCMNNNLEQTMEKIKNVEKGAS